MQSLINQVHHIQYEKSNQMAENDFHTELRMTPENNLLGGK